jgi:branched-chain amino acid transport system substrate-binding protein
MKRILSLASSTVLLVSMVLAGSVWAAGKHYTSHNVVYSKQTLSVRLCSSAPIGVPALHDLVQGIRNGVNLAYVNMKAKLAKAGITLLPANQMDDAKSDGSSYSPDRERSNADACAADPHALGYIGTLNSGAALVSEPVLNKDFMVMISPANTNPVLTSPKARSSQEPATFHHQIPWVTYYRTVTTDALQGPAGAIFAHNDLHARTFFVVDDKLTYGAGLAAAFAAAAKKLGMREVGVGHINPESSASEAATAQQITSDVMSKHPDVVYCGCDSETSLALPRDLRQAGYTKPYMGGDALENTAFITDTGPGAVNDWATSVGPPPSKTSPYFRNLYKKVYPQFYAKPGIQSYDATAYDAARIVLIAILQAKRAGELRGSVKHMREMVVKHVRFINYYGAVGHTTFDNNGDTTNRIISVYKVQGSQWSFVKEVRPPKGYKPTS